MHPIFQITHKHIQDLNDIQARELVARLCRAELRGKHLSESFVTWGGDQRAKDGGVDVRVEIQLKDNFQSSYIPKDVTAFQVKAENFGEAKIRDEMLPKGKLRPLFQNLADAKGAYVIASTKDNLSDSSIISRKTKMQECLDSLAEHILIDFYDSRRIADWAEQFPSIVIWVRQQLGKPLIGWKPYAPWAYREDSIVSDYLIDDKVKVFVPNRDEGITITNAINKLRKELDKPASIRIVGLSGVGKTRLVQALFDGRIVTEYPALNAENVLYTDLADNPEPLPVAMVEALMTDESDSFVIVDNCSSEAHNKLTELVTKPKSRLRLITVEYDIRDDLPESTQVFRLEGASDEVIAELLGRRYPILSPQDTRNITTFSEGNARVAFALASTAETKGELAKLEDAALFERLFIQKHEKSDELQKCAEIISLLYSFDAEDVSNQSELALLAGLAEVSVNALNRNIIEIQRRGLIQVRGKWKAVLPHAIANRLAARAFESYPSKYLVDALAHNSTERVARSFSRRLGFLHDSKKTQEIVADWLKQGGWLGDLASLDETNLQIFLNIASVNQPAAINALLRGIQNETFTSNDNYHRHRFAEVARSLAYEAKYFNHAVEVLIQFALEEPENNKNNSATKVLQSLFFSHLSGTCATIDQRAQVVKSLIMSGDIKKQKLGQELLKAAMEANHFTCMYGFEFGALKRSYGWYPKSTTDVKNWYQAFINIVVEAANLNGEQRQKLISLFANAFRGLWLAGQYEEIVIAVRRIEQTQYLVEIWLAAHTTLMLDKEGLSEESKKTLKSFDEELAPQSLEETVRAKVLSKGLYIFEIEEEQESEPVQAYERARNVAEELGRASAKDEQMLLGLLSELLHSTATDKTLHFGYGVGQQIKQPGHILENARSIIAKQGIASFNLLFMRGLIAGWNQVSPEKVDAFLNYAVEDDVWGLRFPEMQLSIPLDDGGYKRLLKSLEIGLSAAWQYSFLGSGRVTDPLSAQQIELLIHQIAAKPDNGQAVAADIMHMVVYLSAEKSDDYKAELADVCVQFLKNIDWQHFEFNKGNLSYYLKQIVEFTLKNISSENEVSMILRPFLDNIRSGKMYCNYHDAEVIKPFFKHYTVLTLDLLFIPDANGQYASALNLIDSMDWSVDRSKVFSDLKPEAIINWCDIYPVERYSLAANVCHLFETASSEQSEDGCLRLSPLAIKIFENAKDKKAVLDVFVRRFIPSCWSGSLAEILRKRLPLLDCLNTNKEKDLAATIAQAKETLSKQMASELERESAEERSRSLSFE